MRIISNRRRSTLSSVLALLLILALGAPAWAADPPPLTESGIRLQRRSDHRHQVRHEPAG